MSDGTRPGRPTNVSQLLSWHRSLNKLGPLLALFLVYGLFAAMAPPSFRSTLNLELMARQAAVVGTAAVGMTLIIIAAGIDLSVGSIVALVTMVIAMLLKSDFDPLSAALMGVGVGALCGLVNGLLITGLKVLPFIATLGMLLIVRGLAKYLGGEQKIDAPPTSLDTLLASVPAERAWMVLPPGVWMLIFLAYSKLGRHIFAVGSNESTARLCGVGVKRVKVYVYALGGMTAGLAGVLQFSRLGIGSPVTAVGMELDVIAAVVIGGGSLSGGEGSLLGSLAGALIMMVIRSGCTQMDLSNYTYEMIAGTIIIGAVALDRFRHRRAG
jgi:ribose/xylose/arabinose/galactoside ABC-type transport system permease subunit